MVERRAIDVQLGTLSQRFSHQTASRSFLHRALRAASAIGTTRQVLQSARLAALDFSKRTAVQQQSALPAFPVRARQALLAAANAIYVLQALLLMSLARHIAFTVQKVKSNLEKINLGASLVMQGNIRMSGLKHFVLRKFPPNHACLFHYHFY